MKLSEKYRDKINKDGHLFTREQTERYGEYRFLEGLLQMDHTQKRVIAKLQKMAEEDGLGNHREK